MTQPLINGSQIDSTTIDGSGITNVDAATLGGQPVGVGANDILALNGSSQIPAVNGSLLTNVDAVTLGGQPVGTGANDIVALNGSSQLPAVNGSLLTNVDAVTLGGQPVGVTANDIVALNASSQLPAVDGSLLTNIPVIPVHQSLGTITSATDIDPDSGVSADFTFGAAATAEIGFAASTNAVVEMTVEITNGGQGTLTWGVEVQWAGGSAPTLTAAGTDILKFFSRDSNTTVVGWVVALDVS
jgi:hypothetical protein